MIPIYPINFPEQTDHNAEHTVIFQSPMDGSKLKRTGYCNRCGNCCEDLDNVFKDQDGNGNSPGIEQTVPGKCAYFRWGEDGLAICTGQDTYYYKNACAFWPSKKNHLTNYPDCSYIFEDYNGDPNLVP